MSRVEQILAFDKENLLNILHYLAKEVAGMTGMSSIRVYLEDMRGGALECLYTTEGELERKGARMPIPKRDDPLVRSYLESRILDGVVFGSGTDDLHSEWYEKNRLVSSAVFPLLDAGHSIGVLSIDSPRDYGEVLTKKQREDIRQLLIGVMPTLARAHRFNQKMMLNRHLDRLRKRDAARVLLQGAFELGLSLDIASVLVSAVSPVPEALRRERSGYMEVLAAVSKSPADLQVYETLERISIQGGKSLLSRLVMPESDRIVRRPGAPPVLFFNEILAEKFERWEVFNKLALKTLLMIPVEGSDGGINCVVNYFTKSPHRYSDSEVKLLTGHARTLSEGISDVAVEHFEIRVLSEIEQLLAEDTELPVFLGKVVSRAVELAGADSGSIGLVREQDGQRWLVVEEEGRTVGAKSHDWRKEKIPALRIGGEELPPEFRSLTGYVAFTGKPYICADTEAEIVRGGFYRDIAADVKSELAVPIMVGEAVIGVINVDSYRKNFFGTEHQGILQLISRLISSRIADSLKITKLRSEVERLRKEVSYKDPGVSSYLLGNIIGKSPVSLKLVERIGRLAVPLTNRLLNWSRGGEKELELGLPTLLITGETGVGKEFVFNNLYSLLNDQFRKEKVEKTGELPLRKTNIAAFTGELTYTELFGHMKGSYTGAYTDRKGILEEADGGIVFLDEIGDADLKTQVQLLRYIDSGEFSRLGESRMRKSRVILVAATNRDLSEEISKGSFREDLYHRLSEMTLRVPPLRQRKEDIPDLAKHFLGRLHATYGMPGEIPVLTGDAEAYLGELDYPGNIRQLVTVLQGALFESSGSSIGPEEISRTLDLGREEEGGPGDGPAGIYGRILKGEGDFWKLVHGPFMDHELTRQMVIDVYKMALARGGSVRKAALILGALTEKGDDAALMKFRNFMYKTVGLGREK